MTQKQVYNMYTQREKEKQLTIQTQKKRKRGERERTRRSFSQTRSGTKYTRAIFTFTDQDSAHKVSNTPCFLYLATLEIDSIFGHSL